MVNDPHSVLGVSPGADKDEIKKAYRKKAKEYHPDFHQNDPDATRKMNEINEAYDMLMNPEKYTRRQQGTADYSKTDYNTSYGYSTESRGSYSTGNTEDFWGFDFEDIFGFGTRSKPIHEPVKKTGDSILVCKAIEQICMEFYREAIVTLSRVGGYQRDARWHYLNAIANYGAGNRIKALEEIEEALKADPGNQEYIQVYNSMKRTSNTYRKTSREYRDMAEGLERHCTNLCTLYCMCSFCRCI